MRQCTLSKSLMMSHVNTEQSSWRGAITDKTSEIVSGDTQEARHPIHTNTATTGYCTSSTAGRPHLRSTYRWNKCNTKPCSIEVPGSLAPRPLSLAYSQGMYQHARIPPPPTTKVRENLPYLQREGNTVHYAKGWGNANKLPTYYALLLLHLQTHFPIITGHNPQYLSHQHVVVPKQFQVRNWCWLVEEDSYMWVPAPSARSKSKISHYQRFDVMH